MSRKELLDGVGLGDEVEKIEGIDSFEDLEKIDISGLDSEIPKEETKEIPKQEVEEKSTEEVDYNVDELEEIVDSPKKGDLRIAVSQARQKTQYEKAKNELLTQEMESLKQKVKLLGAPQKETVEEDIFEQLGLTSGDVPDVSDLKKIFDNQKKQLQKQQQLITQQENQKIGLEKSKEFNNKFGDSLGDLSYANVYSRFIKGEIKLTKGMEDDINSAVSRGENPAEVFYDYAIQRDPVLKQKQLQLEIKDLISNKKTKNPAKEAVDNSKEQTISSKNALDLKLSSNTSNDIMREHRNKLLKGVGF